MDELINAIYNYGIGIICIAYFMYFNSTTLKSITNTMSEVKQTLVLLNEKIENLEQKLSKKKVLKDDKGDE
jgi:hypothetical protein